MFTNERRLFDKFTSKSSSGNARSRSHEEPRDTAVLQRDMVESEGIPYTGNSIAPSSKLARVEPRLHSSYGLYFVCFDEWISHYRYFTVTIQSYIMPIFNAVHHWRIYTRDWQCQRRDFVTKYFENAIILICITVTIINETSLHTDTKVLGMFSWSLI